MTQGLNNTTRTGEAKYPSYFTESAKKFVLSLHYNGSNSFLFVNATKVYQFKAKDSEIYIWFRNVHKIQKLYIEGLGNISKDFTVDSVIKNRIKRKCKNFFCWL